VLPLSQVLVVMISPTALPPLCESDRLSAWGPSGQIKCQTCIWAKAGHYFFMGLFFVATATQSPVKMQEFLDQKMGPGVRGLIAWRYAVEFFSRHFYEVAKKPISRGIFLIPSMGFAGGFADADEPQQHESIHLLQSLWFSLALLTFTI